MENKKVTYGTPSLMEYVANIKCGKTVLRVPFTGGTITAYGVSPATFTTSNPIFQHAIEASPLFKAGRIVKVSEISLKGENAIKLERNPEPSVPTAAAVEANDGEASGAETPVEENATEGAESDLEAAESAEAPVEAGTTTGSEASGESEDLVVVEVTCLNDAAEYLKEHFNVASRNVRSKSAADEVAASNGVKFNWV